MKRQLGNMETAQATTNEHFPFNAVIIMQITNGPSEETLKKVLEYLQQTHPLLGVHVYEEKGRYFFVSEGTPAIPLTGIERQNGNHWRQAAEEELNRNFDIFTGPLARVTYLTGSGNEKESDIIITFQHSIMDAASAANILNEILSLCREIESRGSIETRKAIEPLPSVEAFFPKTYKGLRRRWNMFLFVLRQMGDEFRYRLRTRKRRKPPIHPSAKCKILPMKLSKKLSEAVIKGSRKKRITLNNVLAAAMLMAAHKHLYKGRELPLRHVHTGDLRPFLIPPMDTRYFGSYFSMMRFTIGMKENSGLWDLARQISDITYASFKKGDKFCALLSSAQMMRMLFRLKSFRMASTAMSFTGPLILEKKYGKIEIRDFHAFVSNFVLGPEYTSLVRLFDNHIYWDILYLDSDMDRKQAGVIADEIRTILESAVKEEL